jgi:hypothetical protein
MRRWGPGCPFDTKDRPRQGLWPARHLAHRITMLSWQIGLAERPYAPSHLHVDWALSTGTAWLQRDLGRYRH